MPPSAYSEWLLYAISAACVLILGVDKTGLGGGLGMLATPILTLALRSSQDAVGILLPVHLFGNLLALWHYRSTFDRANVRRMLPAAIAGIALAALLMGWLRGSQATLDHFLRLLIGYSCLIFVATQLLAGRLARRGEGRGWRPGLAASSATGLVSGFTSTLAHAGGPPVSMFLLPQRLDTRIFIGTTVWFFTITDAIKLIPYGALGLLRWDSLRFSLTLMPLVPVGILLGIWLSRRINQRALQWIVLAMLLLIGLQFVTGKNVTDLVR